MNDQNTLAEIQQKYKNSNLLMPVTSEYQINPFYKYTVMEVKADLSDNSGDIFKVGSVRVGENNWKDTFSPAKPLLMKLAAAAGIQFDPSNTQGMYLSKNCYKACAYGAMRMPDGSGKTHYDEKVINLEDEEDRLRLEFMDKSIEGISDWKAAKAAEKMFKGKWVDTGEVNDKGYPIKKYVIDDADRQKYIERSVLVNMTLLRKTFAEKAMTGAILRVVRALIGMKGQYTKEELQKPFAIPRVTFNPDYSDPEVRRAMLDQGLNSVSNMFGAAASLSSPVNGESPIIVDDFNPEAFVNNAAFSSDHIDDPADDNAKPQQNNNDSPHAPPSASPPTDDLVCLNCNRTITETISKFSKNKYGMPLCMACQKGAN